MKVYDFINDGLKEFNSDSLYTSDVKNICLELNKVLNDVACNIDYSAYLSKECISEKIEMLYKELFLKLHKSLYVDLSDIVLLLKDFQANRKIQGEHYRDHFYHSIQCFLLGLSLYQMLNAADSLLNQNPNVLVSIFSISMYHDLGYLYLVSGKVPPRISHDIKIRFDCEDSWDKANKLKEFLHIEDVKTERLMQCCSSCDLLSIWDQDADFVDDDFLRNLAEIRFGKEYNVRHSYYSAVLLSKILRCKQRIIQELNKSTLEEKILNIRSDNSSDIAFKESIKTILFHDYKQKHLLSFKSDFWVCFLMLVDEMQTYGRPYQDENENIKVLHPAFVEFQYDSNNRLELSCASSLQPPLNAIYTVHSNKIILSRLEEKIEIANLKKIFA